MEMKKITGEVFEKMIDNIFEITHLEALRHIEIELDIKSECFSALKDNRDPRLV